MKTIYKELHDSTLHKKNFHLLTKHLQSKILWGVLLLGISFSGCKKFIEIPPPKTQIVTENVYTDDETATASLRAIYATMISNSGFASGGNSSITKLTGLSSDELINYSASPSQISFYTNSLSSNNSIIQTYLWGGVYKIIYEANAAIEGLNNSKSLSAPVRQQLLGEAQFIRAFCYFYLVNLFGDVPLLLTTNYSINAASSRSTESNVYQQITKDLSDAQNLLSADYSYSSGERVRPNKGAATALLGRVELFLGNWVQAEALSSAVINQNNLYTLNANLNDVFLKNSTEAIWQLMPVIPGQNTPEGFIFILTGMPNNVALSNQLQNSFESGDNRKASWINTITIGSNSYAYPFKYKIKTGTPGSEYSMVLRLSEQYLIRAEARAHLNNLAGGLVDLNTIRNRAGLANATPTDQASLLSAILHERQVELFCEWGHRWLDLKRTGSADAVLGPLKGSNWQSTDILYPLPQSDLINDPNLTQNPGY